MKRLAVLVLLFLALLVSCRKPERTCAYISFGDTELALVKEGNRLLVLDIPMRIVASYARQRQTDRMEALATLLPDTPGDVYLSDSLSRRRMERIFEALKLETENADGWQALVAVKRDELTEEIARLTGNAGLVDLVKKTRHVAHADLDEVLPSGDFSWDQVKPWLDAWYDGALRAGRRSE